MDDENQKNRAEEPQQSYDKSSEDKTVHIFSSFEEMEDENYRWLATLTPEQHLKNAVALIKRIYAKELIENPKLGTDIYFD